MPCRFSKSPPSVTKSQPAWPFWICDGGGAQVGGDERAAQQRFQQRFHGRSRPESRSWRARSGRAAIHSPGRTPAPCRLQTTSCFSSLYCWMASAATLARPDLLVFRSARISWADDGLLGEHQLEVVAQRIFHRRDKLVRHADAVGQRADDGARLAQRGHRAGVESFVRTLQLLQHSQARTFLGLLVQILVLLARTMPAIRPAIRAAGSGAARPSRAWWRRSVFPLPRWR